MFISGASMKRNLLSVGGSVPAVAGGGRQRAAAQRAVRGGRRFALADIIGIGNALEKTSRGGRLTLLVTCERAVAQPRVLVSLKAERISGADGFGGRGAQCGQSAGGKYGQNRFTHFESPHHSSALCRFHFHRHKPHPRTLVKPFRLAIPSLS